MPCIDHYPTDEELHNDRRKLNKHRIEIAKLVAYAALRLKVKEPPEITEMIAYTRAPENKTLPDCAPLLCKLLTKAGKSGKLEDLIYGNPKDRMGRELATWWEDHLQADLEREQREQREAESKKMHEARVREKKAEANEWLKNNKETLRKLPKLLTYPIGSEVLFVDGEASGFTMIGKFALVVGAAVRSDGVCYSTTLGSWYPAKYLRLVRVPTKTSLELLMKAAEAAEAAADEADEEDEE